MPRKQRDRIDETVVAAHADDLARIVPLLGIEDLDVFWTNVRTHWNAADFADAIDQFCANGTLEPFRHIANPMPRASRTKRPNGFWDDIQNVLSELAEWRATHDGEFPTVGRLTETKRSSLAYAISKHGGYPKMRELLGELGGNMPDGYWQDVKNVHAAIRAWQTEHGGKFPSKKTLDATGHARLTVAIGKFHGGFLAVRATFGENLTARPYGYWKDFEHVRQVLEAYRDEHGRLPTGAELKNVPGTGSVCAAIGTIHGGMDAVRERLGETTGGWTNFENVRPVLENFRKEHGRLPSFPELSASGNAAVANAISRYHGGYCAVRRRMGEADARPRKARGHWQNLENVATAIREWSDAHDGKFPTGHDLAGTELSGLMTTVSQYHGGVASVRSRLGYDRVTDAAIGARADALARIIPALGVDPSNLWSRIKRSWTTRALDAAIAEYAANGTIKRFALLDG